LDGMAIGAFSPQEELFEVEMENDNLEANEDDEEERSSDDDDD